MNNQIYLRPMLKEDTEYIVKWRNLQHVRSNFIYQKPFTKEGHEQWISSMIEMNKAIQFMICTVAEDKKIGSVYFRDISLEHKKAEYGIFLGEKEYIGQGIGTQVANLAIEYGFETMKFHKINLRVFANNAGAIGSYKKAGFKQEALLKDEVCINGEYRDIILMAIINH